jgi:hypothetical protein
LEEIQDLVKCFYTFELTNVYMEHNKEVDQLSKEGIMMDYGSWFIVEELNVQHY